MAIRVFSRVFDTSQHKESRLLVLLALADRADEDGVCWPSQETLCERARLSDIRAVRRIVRALADSGEIYVESGGGRGVSSRYLVTCGLDADAIARTLVKRFDMVPAAAIATAADLAARMQAAAAPADAGEKEDFGGQTGTLKPSFAEAEKRTLEREKRTLEREKRVPGSPDPFISVNRSVKGGDARDADPPGPPPPPCKSEKKSSGPKPDPEYDAVAGFLRGKGFRLNPEVRSSRIVKWLGRYPPDWIMRAAAIAAARGDDKRKLAYVGGILRSFEEEGGPDDDSDTRPANRHPANDHKPAQQPNPDDPFEQLADLTADLIYGGLSQADYDAAVAALGARYPGVLNV